MRRRDLDQMVADNAVKAGATVWQDAEATAPILESGLVRGAIVNGREVRAKYVVVADGANSRFGRAIGTARDSLVPAGHGDPRLLREPAPRRAVDRERRSTCSDRNGNTLPGYGWIFPVGDGTVNVGVGLLSTFRDFEAVNTTHLLDEYVADSARATGRSPRTLVRCAHRRSAADGRLGRPQGRPDVRSSSATPRASSTRSTAKASTTPTRPAGSPPQVLHEALTTGDGLALQQYPKLLDDEYGLYFKVARLFAQVIGRPALMRELTRVGMQSAAR